MTPSGIKLLLDGLREEHFQILMGLNNARNEGLASQRGRRELEAVLELLLRHVHTEDGKFYPLLDELSKADEQLKRLLEAVPAGMLDIRDRLQGFFKSIEENPGQEALAASFNRLYADVKRRIEREENVLFLELGDE